MFDCTCSGLQDIYAGSVESTSAAEEWGIAALLNSPHLLKRAHQELDRAVGKDRRVEESDIANLPFLQASHYCLTWKPPPISRFTIRLGLTWPRMMLRQR